jgi:hypothetical protein
MKNRKPGSRCHQLNLSLTENELLDIKRRSEALGMRTAHFARGVLLNASKIALPENDRHSQAFRRIRLELQRIGQNLNQCVRKFHQTNLPMPADLEPLLHDIRQLIARIP